MNVLKALRVYLFVILLTGIVLGDQPEELILTYGNGKTQVTLGRSVYLLDGDSLQSGFFVEFTDSKYPELVRTAKNCNPNRKPLQSQCLVAIIVFDGGGGFPNVNSYIRALLQIGVTNVTVSVQK